MKIGVIIDGTKLARWQAEALRTLERDHEFVIYSCENSVPARRSPRHALYYLLNLLTIRNRLTRGVELPGTIPVVVKQPFEALCEGAWESLPPEILQSIKRDRPVVLVKFGMGLLKVPPPEQLAVPILSYHHGDPARFRGRPAGFYELLQGEQTVGQIVQILSNKLDAGRIVAAAETRAIAHSYRATLIEAYRHSPLLLRTAVANAVAGIAWEPPEWGPVYRLPDTATVLKFVATIARNAVSRLFYGLFREKSWKVATVRLPNPLTIESLIERLADEARWEPVAAPPPYRFLADPFFHPDGGLLVEAMRSASARGEILHVADGRVRRLSGRGGHFSYPAVISSANRWHLVPEMSEWSSGSAYPLVGDSFGEPFELRIPGRPRLLDPTPLRHGDTLFLFGNIASEGQSVLRLWVADDLDGDFVEHPASPLRISPNGARMAGSLVTIDDRLVRVGQDLRGGYGDGIAFFEVTRIDRSHYAEELVGAFRFADRRGPHTLNLSASESAFDYYVDAFSPLAGIRRLRERRAARRIGD